MKDTLIARKNMVDEQLVRRGIKDQRVLNAFLEVPRHKFVEEYLKYKAYDDYPLSIGYGQTISQPYMVALMTEAINPQPAERILEIGTGSGYQAAILSRLCSAVYTIERISALASRARKALDDLGYFNVHIRLGDGTMGLPQDAPYDGIIVTAGAPHVPESLIGQLREDGRLIIPIGDEGIQDLKRIIRTKDGVKEESLGGCRFVKLIGKNGWQP
jgi:protein-L-isoaspartate(D-aspartate) O-methyltransferase